ncbi:teneurin-3-like [Astatotilapia calliptera]|uniref:teneurin-3-like n=1 Tax=Astatotilapia calliptera TaxID=8154 RepID=UPI000E3FC221|nr:teneurin-3-like [Astatotilapia calliptera]
MWSFIGSPMPSPSCPSVIDQSHPQSANPHDNPLLANIPEPNSEEEEEEEEYAARLYLAVTCEQPSNHHNSSLPPVPPPHRQQPSVTALSQALSATHHTGQSLNSTRQLTPPTGSPAPVAGQSPAELQTTPPESVPLQDSWVLGSNVPLETR